MPIRIRDVILALMLGVFVVVGPVTAGQLHNIADRMETATIGGTRVPAIECAEDEVISWLGVDTLGCVHFEDVE